MATSKNEYTSSISEVNQLPSIYREGVDLILWEYCLELSESEAKKDLAQVIKVLQEYLDK